ncbi:MAG: LysR family transcriptional regulator [Burkholderiaceae bacterium]|nr:LysR family transcriptional regulator [Burkholderiaceae bacterium]
MNTSRSPSFRSLDLNLLRVFDVVMEERNVTRAAARLSITQPAVSNALRRLREATNEEQLFVPTAAGMQPTPHAEALWPVVRAALAKLQEAFEHQQFDPRSGAQSFTLAMADATAALFVPLLVQRFEREGIRVGLRIVPLTSRDPREMLEQGRADVALGFFPDVASLPLADDDTGVIRHAALYSSAYICVMRREHPLAAPGALTLECYCAAQHLRVSFAGRPHGFVDEALARVGRRRHVVITVNSFFTAGLAVRQSDLLTVLPSGFVAASGQAADLACRPVPFALPGIDVSQVWHARHAHEPAQRWLREELNRAAVEIAQGSAAN